MIIGLSGAQGVGKTTLLNSLRDHESTKHFEFKMETIRWIKDIGVNINESGDDITQYIVAMKHLQNLFLSDSDHVITDRTMLDCYIYTIYLYENNKVSIECLNEIRDMFLKSYQKYNFIFYIKPEFDIKVDGVRSTSKQFQNKIAGIFEEIISRNMNNVYYLTGTVEQRVNQLISIITREDI